MKKISVAIIASLGLLAASCNTEEFSAPAAYGSGDGLRTITASVEDGTKVALGSDLSVSWVEQDAISIFAEGKNEKFFADEAGTTSSFTIEPDSTAVSASMYYALYPYNAAATIDGNKISTVIPNYQIAVKGGINPQYLVMASKSEDGTFAMKNAVALLKISLTDDNVSSVNIVAKGNAKIAGKVSITLPDSGDPVIAASASSVLLVPERDGDGVIKSAFAPGDYYVAVAPAVVSAGFEVVLTNKDDDNLGIKSSSNSCTLYRSEVMNLSDLCSVVSWVPTTKTGLVFWTGSAFADPFASPAIGYGTSFSYTDESKFVPADLRNTVVTAVANEKNGGLTYKLFAQKGYWKNSTQGFRGFPDEGDYIEFPALPGLSLKAVKWTIGGVGSNNYPGLATTSGTFVCGGDPYEMGFKVGDFAVWVNADPAENTAYRVTPAASGTAVSCRKLELLYVGTPTPEVLGVTTSEAKDVKATGATLEGSFSSFGSSDVAADFLCGFEYKTGAGAWTSVDAGTVAASFSAVLTGLTENAEYTFRAWARSLSGEKVYGSEATFIASELIVKNYIFADGTSKFQLFSKTISTSSGSPTSVAARYDVKDKSDSSLEFSLYSTGGLYLNSSQGLRYGTLTVGDYMIFPAISGKKLIKIEITSSSKSYFTTTDIKAVTDISTAAFGTTLASDANTGSSHVYNISETAIGAGERVALVATGTNSNNQWRILSMTLTFK